MPCCGTAADSSTGRQFFRHRPAQRQPGQHDVPARARRTPASASGAWTSKASRRSRRAWRTSARRTAPPRWPRATSRCTRSSTCWRRSPATAVDNAIIELDANEPPIADGSAREYCRMIEAAGIVPQAEQREPYTVTEPIELRSGETLMTLFPARRLQDHLHQRGQAGAVHPVFQRRSHARDLGDGPGARPDVLLLRGDRVSDQERPDQGRQPGERRGHSR